MTLSIAERLALLTQITIQQAGRTVAEGRQVVEPPSFYEYVESLNPDLLRYEHIPKIIPIMQMVIDGDAVIDGVDSGSDYHVSSVLVIGGRVRFIGNFKVFRNVHIRRFRLGAPRVSVRSSGTNGSMNDIEIGGGVVTFAEPFEFQPGDRVSVNGGLVDILHASPNKFWSLILNAGRVNFYPVKDAKIGEVHLNGGLFDTRLGTAFKDIQRLIRTGGRLRLDNRTDITETIDLTRQ